MKNERVKEMIESVERTGVSFDPEAHRFLELNTDYVLPYILLTLCLKGSSQAMYDMQEFTLQKNDMAFVMPGHMIRPISRTDDHKYARFCISSKLFDDLRFSTFSHDYDKFHFAPVCTLTDDQAGRLMAMADQVAFINERTEKELPHRRFALLAQLAIGYELLNYFRHEQDKQWCGDTRQANLFSRFCDLVVEHYRESREVSYYAAMLHLTPKYFSKLIQAQTRGISPSKWIEEYVVAQAKRYIKTHPGKTLQEIAFVLGFPDPTSFYRYFKRVTGMTAKQYREKNISF